MAKKRSKASSKKAKSKAKLGLPLGGNQQNQLNTKKTSKAEESLEAEDLSKADERRFEPEENLNVKQHVNRKGKRGQRLDDQQVQDTMAARSRPRNGAVKDDPTDTHEELSLWEQIKRDLEKCSVIQKRSREVSKLIVETEASMGKSPSVKEIDDLQALYRENVKLADEEWRMLNEEPADLIKNLGILQALRTASENEPQRPVPGPSKARKPKAVAPKPLDMDGAADSPGPSPSVSTSASRLKGSSARSESVASARDIKTEHQPIIKIEDTGAEGTKGPSAEKADKFFVGAEVAYKQNKVKEDGSQWIQCNIIRVTGEGSKKRYEVQDPEPDSETGAPGHIYRAASVALIAIPPPSAPLPEYSVGKTVLARYPETTTFYRAEVTGYCSSKTEGGKDGKDETKEGVYCMLKFEDDQNQEMKVDRRFVLDYSGR